MTCDVYSEGKHSILKIILISVSGCWKRISINSNNMICEQKLLKGSFHRKKTMHFPWVDFLRKLNWLFTNNMINLRQKKCLGEKLQLSFQRRNIAKKQRTLQKLEWSLVLVDNRRETEKESILNDINGISNERLIAAWSWMHEKYLLYG